MLSECPGAGVKNSQRMGAQIPVCASMCSVQSVRSIMCFAYCVMAVDVYTVAMRA